MYLRTTSESPFPASLRPLLLAQPLKAKKYSPKHHQLVHEPNSQFIY